MKKIFFGIALLSIVFACKKEKPKEAIKKETTVATIVKENIFPKELVQIFDTHGGLGTWDKMNNLCFEIKEGDNKETHTTSLKDRKSKIEHKKWSIGANGDTVWLLENQENAYKGNARFYHNLMFYFHAMPFILSDDGINYTPVAAQSLNGKDYPGIKISYNEAIGDTPEDEYILFYDPDTFTMEWLAYTVTFKSGEKNDNWKFIKYSEWITVNNLLLPKTLTWYNVKEGFPTTKRNDLVFENIIVSETLLEEKMFNKPEEAVSVEK